MRGDALIEVGTVETTFRGSRKEWGGAGKDKKR